METSQITRANFLEGLLVGSLAGVMAGILLAPKSGREFRSELEAKSKETKDKAEALLAEARHRVKEFQKEVSEGRSKVKEILTGHGNGGKEGLYYTEPIEEVMREEAAGDF